uniref:Uncharacterized protein n=1 Tax=Parascaris univalens TaxID=6257 RepID=A0A915BUT3_PARUN
MFGNQLCNKSSKALNMKREEKPNITGSEWRSCIDALVIQKRTEIYSKLNLQINDSISIFLFF